jgi:omega-6 fatty acid desaturase (delta-12 desaturase)
MNETPTGIGDAVEEPADSEDVGASTEAPTRASAKNEERREGAALVRATKPFDVEDVGLTWRLLATTLLVFAAAYAGAILAPWWPVQVASGVVAGLVNVRLFIFFHDAMHGAIFRDSWLGMRIMDVVGWYTLCPASVWRETHDYHHQHNAKMIGASIGSYPMVTVKMWQKLEPSKRFWYKFARNPLTIAFGYFTIFVGGMCIAAFLREPKKHWQAPIALMFHFGIILAIYLAFGWQAALLGGLMPNLISFALGAYLFYAQHNFPTIDIRDRRTWTYHHAALRSSSFFEMPALLHWFTGNIGYHHVHHLNHRIPFYHLPAAMAEIPALQSPGRTSWHPRDVLACLRLKLWDQEKGHMVGWDAV